MNKIKSYYDKLSGENKARLDGAAAVVVVCIVFKIIGYFW